MKKPIAVIVLFLGTYVSYYSQINSLQNSVIVSKNKKQIDLKKFDELNIVHNIVRNGTDSLTREIDCDSIVRVGDTLIVRPWSISEERFAYDDKPTKIELTYDHPSTNVLKIPVKEIERIKVKNQPLSFILSSVVAVSYAGVLAGVFYPKGTDQQLNTGTAIIVTAVPVLIASFTCRLVFGKKKLRFDKQRTDKKTWGFQ